MANPAPVGSDVSAGTYKCTNCGYELEVQSVQSLPPCPKCEGPYSWEALSGGDSTEDPYPDQQLGFLRKRRIESTELFWAALEKDAADAPEAVQRLARGERAVGCDEHEANEALAWASRHPEWSDAPAPLYLADGE